MGCHLSAHNFIKNCLTRLIRGRKSISVTQRSFLCNSFATRWLTSMQGMVIGMSPFLTIFSLSLDPASIAWPNSKCDVTATVLPKVEKIESLRRRLVSRFSVSKSASMANSKGLFRAHSCLQISLHWLLLRSNCSFLYLSIWIVS